MTSIWVESLGRSFDQALDLLAAAVRDCTDDLWEASMWEVPADVFGPAPPGPDGKPVTDPAARHALAQRRSTPWSMAWHAREGRDEAVRMAARSLLSAPASARRAEAKMYRSEEQRRSVDSQASRPYNGTATHSD
jgi:hypothetical protein